MIPAAMKEPKDRQWKGLAFDELAYERAVTLARAEIERHRLSIEMDRARQGNILLSRSTFSKVLGVVSFTDMIVLGMKLWRSLSPLFGRRRRR